MTLTDVAAEPAQPDTVMPMNSRDKCDRCGSQAFSRASILTDTGKTVDLVFCGHHFHLYHPGLTTIALFIQDETARINTAMGA